MIINGELTDRARRRRLPGLDDRLQRRLRGRPADRRADEPRALHQPLPAGPRRDRQLPGHRPQVRQRHRPLAAAAHVRRLVVADGRLYGTPLHRRVESETRAARRHRRRRRSKRVPDPTLFVGETVRRGDRRALALDERRAEGLRRRRRRCSTTRRGTRPTAASRRSSASGRSRSRSRPEEKTDDRRRRHRPGRRRPSRRGRDAGDDYDRRLSR